MCCVCRALKRRVLRAWVRYVPVEREERGRERRREAMRSKVASWLSDYQPHPQDN